MRESGMTTKEDGNPDPSLNEYQLRALLVSCQHIDKLLGEIEGLLNSSKSGLAFPKYFDDLSSAQHDLIDDYIRRTRADLLQVAAEQGIVPESGKIPASHSIHATMIFIEIAIEELRPDKMRGYGPMSKDGAAYLNQLVQRFHASAQQLHRCVLQREAP
jgi:hypothetical protein